VLLLVADPVVCNTERRAEDVVKECLETDIKVVGHNIGVVLDIRPHDPLPGLVVACKIVCKPWEVPLEVVPLHICTAKGQEYGRYGRTQETGMG
jgi:hypothetical protein